MSENLYQISVDGHGVLVVNSTPIELPDMSIDERLAWALEQVALVHASLGADAVMRVEVDDTTRPRGYGTFATDVPAGSVLTLDMVIANANRENVRRFGDNPTGEVYDVDHVPLYPPTPITEGLPDPLPNTEDTRRILETWGFGDDTHHFPYQPKEPLPHIERRERPQRGGKGSMKTWSTRRKALTGVGVVALVGAGIFAGVEASRGPSVEYSRVCVNNMSYQRLTDAECVTPEEATSRWWYANPDTKVPAVGNYALPDAGTFTKPTGKSVGVKTNIDPKGVTPKPVVKHSS